MIGEDLGNVEPWVRDYLSSRGILGTSVLWFEHENGGPTPPENYREALLAPVNTHDLPPTAGYLAGEHVDLRARLGLLTRPVAEERADAERERDTMLALLRQRGLIGPDATEQEMLDALVQAARQAHAQGEVSVYWLSSSTPQPRTDAWSAYGGSATYTGMRAGGY